MRQFVWIGFACACIIAQAQSPAPAQPQSPAVADPVVVTIEGTPFTKSELEKFVRSLPESATQSFYANKKAFLDQFGLMMKLSKLAEKEGIDKDFPHAQRITYNRWIYLAQTMIQTKEGSFPVSFEDQKKYYDEKGQQFAAAKVKMLYIAFNNNPSPSTDPAARKPLNEKQAQEKISGLVKQIRAGADFSKIAAEHSDDAESKAKGGEFGSFKPSDQTLPPAIKTAIFSLKPGEVTEPIRQANGFYVFRLDSFDKPEFDKVKDEIFVLIRKERLDAWMDSVRKSLAVEINDPKYLTEPGGK